MINACIWIPTDNPQFEQVYTPAVQGITGSSVRVSWPKPKNIKAGLERHYYYIVWLQTDGGTFNNISRVPQLPGQQQLRFRINGLTFNTTYSVYVEPYRQHDTWRESGAKTGVTVFTITSTGT